MTAIEVPCVLEDLIKLEWLDSSCQREVGKLISAKNEQLNLIFQSVLMLFAALDVSYTSS